MAASSELLRRTGPSVYTPLSMLSFVSSLFLIGRELGCMERKIVSLGLWTLTPGGLGV